MRKQRQTRLAEEQQQRRVARGIRRVGMAVPRSHGRSTVNWKGPLSSQYGDSVPLLLKALDVSVVENPLSMKGAGPG